MGIDNPVHLLFIAVIALLVLGPKRLPELARAVGKGVREFREAINIDGSAGQAQITTEAAPFVSEAKPAEEPPGAHPPSALPPAA
jgi:TatA/E family protein of Tat protein translocase